MYGPSRSPCRLGRPVSACDIAPLQHNRASATICDNCGARHSYWRPITATKVVQRVCTTVGQQIGQMLMTGDRSNQASPVLAQVFVDPISDPLGTARPELPKSSTASALQTEQPPEEPAPIPLGLTVVGLVLAIGLVLAALAFALRSTYANMLAKRSGARQILKIVAAFALWSSGWFANFANLKTLVAGTQSNGDFWFALWAAIFFVAGLLLVEILEVGSSEIDARVEALEKEKSDLAKAIQDHQEEVSEANRVRMLALAMNQFFRRVVGTKSGRFRSREAKLIGKSGQTSEQLLTLEEAHGPTTQYTDMLAGAYGYLERYLQEKGIEGFRLRVATFRPNDAGRRLENDYSYDGVKRDVAKGPRRPNCRGKFDLKKSDPRSLAVQAAYHESCLIEPDTTVPEDDLKTAFRHYGGSDERGQMLSIVAIPLGSPMEGCKHCRRILCVDVNVTNAFNEEDTDVLEELRANLDDRLTIELIQASSFRGLHRRVADLEQRADAGGTC